MLCSSQASWVQCRSPAPGRSARWRRRWSIHVWWRAQRDLCPLRVGRCAGGSVGLTSFGRSTLRRLSRVIQIGGRPVAHENGGAKIDHSAAGCRGLRAAKNQTARVVHRAFQGFFVEHRRDVSSGALCGGAAQRLCGGVERARGRVPLWAGPRDGAQDAALPPAARVSPGAADPASEAGRLHGDHRSDPPRGSAPSEEAGVVPVSVSVSATDRWAAVGVDRRRRGPRGSRGPRTVPNIGVRNRGHDQSYRRSHHRCRTDSGFDHPRGDTSVGASGSSAREPEAPNPMHRYHHCPSYPTSCRGRPRSSPKRTRSQLATPTFSSSCRASAAARP